MYGSRLSRTEWAMILDFALFSYKQTGTTLQSTLGQKFFRPRLSTARDFTGLAQTHHQNPGELNSYEDPTTTTTTPTRSSSRSVGQDVDLRARRTYYLDNFQSPFSRPTMVRQLRPSLRQTIASCCEAPRLTKFCV